MPSPDPMLTREEEIALHSRILANDEAAIGELVRRSERVQYWAAGYIEAARRLTLQERKQACAMGAVEAARRFDPSKGRFTTYAMYWMEKFLRLDQKNGGVTATGGFDMALIRDGEASEIGRARAEANAEISKRLERLSGRDREVIELRYGIDGEMKTQEEVALLLGITPGRVHQIEVRAMKILRKRKLREVVE